MRGDCAPGATMRDHDGQIMFSCTSISRVSADQGDRQMGTSTVAACPVTAMATAMPLAVDHLILDARCVYFGMHRMLHLAAVIYLICAYQRG